MASTITLSVDVQVQGGPKASYALIESVDAYDLIEVVIPKKTGTTAVPKEVLIQPAGLGQVRVLSITADHYTDLTYKPKAGTEGTNAVVLNSPQLLVGGAVGLLEKPPQSLVFTNNSTTNPVTVRILAGREA